MTGKNAMKVTVMPAGHGDSILVQCDDFNILVDSGPHNAKIHKRVYSALVSALNGRPIDLAIVTHHDDDHIGGLERMLNNSTLSVRALLFNSPNLIHEHIDRAEEVNVSARQAINVATKLKPCNAKAVVAGDELNFFDGRITLSVLSPWSKDILKFGPGMIAAIGKEESVGSLGRETPICGRIDELLSQFDDNKASDKSEANALSLAFILTFEERSILFLGDSWPSRVTPFLAMLSDGGARIPLDMVFVSHHGSKNNTTVELYSNIETERYVISTDGKQNPDVETFGRILRAAAPKRPEFYFSERTYQLETMFSRSDINVRFPGDCPLTFHL